MGKPWLTFGPGFTRPVAARNHIIFTTACQKSLKSTTLIRACQIGHTGHSYPQPYPHPVDIYVDIMSKYFIRHYDIMQKIPEILYEFILIDITTYV